MAAIHVKRLSISILTTNNYNTHEKVENPSILRVSPSNPNHKNSATGFIGQNIPENTSSKRIVAGHAGKQNEMTPHVQSTYIKSALQKEKSKRMIKLLSKKGSGFL